MYFLKYVSLLFCFLFFSIYSHASAAVDEEITEDIWNLPLTESQKLGFEKVKKELDLYSDFCKNDEKALQNELSAHTKTGAAFSQEECQSIQKNLASLEKNRLFFNYYSHHLLKTKTQGQYRLFAEDLQKVRLDYLKEREKRLVEKGCGDVIPSHPKLLKLLSASGKEQSEFNQHIALMTIDRFEVLSRICIILISHMGEALTQINKADKLYHYIQVSRSLHWHFQTGNLTNILGPDEVGGYAFFAIQAFGKHWENTNFSTNRRRNSLMRGLQILENRRNDLSSRLCTSDPDWAQLRERMDGELYSATTHHEAKSAYVKKLKLFGLGVTNNRAFDATLIQKGEIVPELRPYYEPELILSCEEKMTEILKRASELVFIEPTPSFETSAEAAKGTARAETTRADDISLAKTKKKTVMPATPETALSASGKQAQLDTEKNIHCQRTLRLAQGGSMPSASFKKPSVKVDSTDKRKFWKDIDKIFDHTQLRNITWKNFQTAWENKLGHAIRNSSGGSHHTATLKNGKEIGGTYKPHKNPTFSPGAVKNLRELLLQDSRVRAHFNET